MISWTGCNKNLSNLTEQKYLKLTFKLCVSLKNVLAYIYLRESAIRKILQNTYFISLSDQKVVKVSSDISKSMDCISITTFKDFFGTCFDDILVFF